MARNNLYSRIVVWVKVTLPLIALGLLSTLFLFSSTPDPDDALPYSDVDIDSITREQRVTNPRFAGVLGDDQELVLTAEAVTMEGGQSDRIRAQQIAGRMDLSGTDFVTVEAAFGDFDMAAQVAALTDGVTLESTLGYSLESETLDMALDRVEMRSPTPVHVTGPGMDLTADGMEMTGPDGETILRFIGTVRMVYDPEN